MKTITKSLLVGIMVLSLLGCGGPTLDTSSESARKESAQKMVSELTSPAEKAAFKKALSGIYVVGMFATLGGKISEEEAVAKIDAKVNGKTVKEIMALAAELKQAMNK